MYSSDIFVTCSKGLESLLAEELEEMGITAKKGFCGVFISKTSENVFKVNYCSRIATRVLWPISFFSCKDAQELYHRCKKIDWLQLLKINQTFSLDANVTHPNIKNSHYAALVIKDAICDYFREKKGSRPNVQVHNPDVQFNLFIQNGNAVVYFDTSGAPLFKRGYREEMVDAPLQESLAAAIIRLAKYQGNEIFCDPFCGSGTLLIEAAMAITQTPAGYFRKTWGFLQTSFFSSSDWHQFKQKTDQNIASFEKGFLFGSDFDPKAIDIAKKNLEKTGFSQYIELERKDIRSLFPKSPPTLIITNPPYGKRLSANLDLFQAFNSFIQTRCSSNVKVNFLTSDTQYLKEFTSDFKKIISLSNGGINVDLYSS